jgi:hypothetical protein
MTETKLLNILKGIAMEAHSNQEFSDFLPKFFLMAVSPAITQGQQVISAIPLCGFPNTNLLQ